MVVAGSAGYNFAVAFKSELSGTSLSFSPIQDQLPVIMTDNEGTTWDVFGNGISGPRAGQRLSSPRSFTAYWFAWVAFCPGAEIAAF